MMGKSLNPKLARAVRQAQAAIQRSGQIVRPASTEEVERFGVGGCGCDACKSGGPCGSACYGLGDPGLCYEKVAAEQACEMHTIAGAAFGVIGGDVGRIVVNLDMSDYFMPVFVRLFGMDNDAASQVNPSISRIFKVTAVRIGKIPQECFDETEPDPATHLQGVFSDSWDHFTRDGNVLRSGVRVRWGCFSRDTLSKPLELTMFAPQPNTNRINAHCEVTGYCIDRLPAGWKVGEYPGDYAAGQVAA